MYLEKGPVAGWCSAALTTKRQQIGLPHESAGRSCLRAGRIGWACIQTPITAPSERPQQGSSPPTVWQEREWVYSWCEEQKRNPKAGERRFNVFCEKCGTQLSASALFCSK